MPHPAIDSLQRFKPPSTMDLVKKGAEVTGETVGDAWNWATTPSQPAGEDAGFIENTLADFTSPAGIAEAWFPGVAGVKKPMQALWKGVGTPQRKIMDKVESVARGLGPAEREMMEQTNISVDPDMSMFGKFKDPDETFSPIASQELPDYFKLLKRDGMLPGEASVNPNFSEEQIAQTLRHELRHANQFYNQGQNFTEGKSLMTPGNMYDTSHEAGAFPFNASVPMGLSFNNTDRYFSNPFEIDARSVQPGGAADPDRIAAMMETSMSPSGASNTTRSIQQAVAENPTDEIDDKVLDLLYLTDDSKRLSPDLPEGYLAGDPLRQDLDKRVFDAKSNQRGDVRSAMQALMNSLGLK